MNPEGATNKLLKLCTATVIAGSLTLSSASAQGAAKKPATKAPTAPAKPTLEVKKEDFRIVVSLPAVFEATKMTPVKVEPKEWKDLIIKSIVAHGTKVKRGTRLVELDLEALEKQIATLDEANKSAKLTLQNSLDSLANAEKTTPLKLEAANRTLRQSNENLKRWLKVGRTRDEERYKRNVESSERQLEYAQEELNQLQKMYEEDDLTEETEEIILKRAKIGVEQSTYFLKLSRESRDYALKTTIPRNHQAQVDSNKQAKITHSLAVRSIPRALELQRLAVEKAREDARKATKKLSDLKRDFETLNDITAPSDGIVYYGKSTRGVWSSAEAAKKLVPRGKIVPKSVFLTIVNHGGLRAQTTVPEDKLAMLKPGTSGHLTPTSAPLTKIPAKLGKINYATSPIGFKAAAKLQLPEKHTLMPGMKGKLTFVIADHKNVITVPVDAIKMEDGKTYVFVVKKDADPEKREVRIAETDGKKVVVLKGLKAKETILTLAP